MPPARGGPVLLEQPFLGLSRMSLPQHAPELFEDIGINAAEGIRCNHVAVVIGPAAKRSAWNDSLCVLFSFRFDHLPENDCPKTKEKNRDRGYEPVLWRANENKQACKNE